MRKVLVLGIGAALAVMAAMPVAANAQNRTLTAQLSARAAVH